MSFFWFIQDVFHYFTEGVCVVTSWFFYEREPRIIEPTLVPNFAPWVNIDKINNRWALTFSPYVHEPGECWDPAINTTLGAMEYFRFYPVEWDDTLARAKMLKIPLMSHYKEINRFGTNVFANMIYSWNISQQREFFLVMGMSSDEINDFFKYHIQIIQQNIFRLYFMSKYNEITAPALLERGHFLCELLLNTRAKYNIFTDLDWIRDYGQRYTAYYFPGVEHYGEERYFQVRTMWGWSGYYPRRYEYTEWGLDTWFLYYLYMDSSILYYHSKIFTYFPNFIFDSKYSNAPKFIQLLYLKLLAFNPERIHYLYRFFEWIPYSWKW